MSPSSIGGFVGPEAPIGSRNCRFVGLRKAVPLALTVQTLGRMKREQEIPAAELASVTGGDYVPGNESVGPMFDTKEAYDAWLTRKAQLSGKK